MMVGMTMRFAFGCQKRVGKDTACKYLKNKYGGCIIRFSEPLYDILKYACNRSNVEFRKDRRFLQWIGTDWGRSIDKNIWINALINDVNTKYKGENLFVADLRFPNEMKALRENGFKLVRIMRDVDNDDSHESETALLNIPLEEWDYVINNNSSLDAFFKQLDQI